MLDLGRVTFGNVVDWTSESVEVERVFTALDEDDDDDGKRMIHVPK